MPAAPGGWIGTGARTTRMVEGKAVKSRIGLVLGLGIVAVVAGVLVFLATWTIPAPSTTVERVIPNEKFSR